MGALDAAMGTKLTVSLEEVFIQNPDLEMIEAGIRITYNEVRWRVADIGPHYVTLVR